MKTLPSWSRAVVLVVVSVCAGNLAAQVAPYGSGCDGLFPSSTISYTGSVTPGQNAAIRIDGAPPNAVVILHAGNEAIDLDVSSFEGVADGCRLLVNPNIAYLALPTNAQGSLKIGFKVPGSLGSDLYYQWAVVEQVTPPSVTLGEALHVSLDTSPFVNPVAFAPDVVDYDGDGEASVLLDGSGSYTHELGHAIEGHLWRVDGETVATTAVTNVPLALGEHAVTLHVLDDNSPPDTALALSTVRVLSATEVPGISARLHDASGGSASALLDAVPASADWADVVAAFALDDGGGVLGNSPFNSDVMAVLQGAWTLPAPADVTWLLDGGVDTRLFVDGTPTQTGVAAPLAAGTHTVEARFAVDTLADAPLAVRVALDGAPPVTLDNVGSLTHDESTLAPVLNSIVPAIGSSSGGTTVTLTGQGFFPAVNVFVFWGNSSLTIDDGLIIAPDRIEFSAPPEPAGDITVRVLSGPGISNERTFTYVDTGPVPSFTAGPPLRVNLPTQIAWGPDGRLYVSEVNGTLRAITFDDDHNVVSQQVYGGISGLSNSNAMGLAFSPFDAPDPVRLYVAHGLLYGDGGTIVPNPSPYRGQVSVLTGPNFDTPEPLVTSLPQSNSGHAVNGLVFDHNGDLLILVGCNTNAGVADFDMGSLPESPLSGAILKAETSRPDFDGQVTYTLTSGGGPSADQRDGEIVDVVPGPHVHVHAPGLRNPYDLVFTTTARLYATDNGPNLIYGPGSTGLTTVTPFDPAFPDELLLLEAGRYYGSPNRARGRTDARQLVYRDPTVPSLPGEFAQTLVSLPSSTDGIDEYRSETFGGQMRGELLVQQWNAGSRRLRLADDGRSVTGNQALSAFDTGLDIRAAPGGTIILADHNASAIRILRPDEPGATGSAPLVVLDVIPWRAPAASGVPFVIGGRGFGQLADTTVTFDGIPALLTSVSDTRIRGITPSHPSPTTDLIDIQVTSLSGTSGGGSDTLTDAFRFLFPIGTEPGRWETLAPVPTALENVATAEIGGVIYVVGAGTSELLGYDVHGKTWLSGLASRPFAGSHHAADVVGAKLYLIGGLGAGAEGRVQVYDPASDTWSLGSDLPWAGGAVATACIDGTIYAAGGLVGGLCTNAVAAYNPTADTWTMRAPMPFARAESAGGTDGSSLVVIGGRNSAGSPTANTLIYSPGTDTWSAGAALGLARRALGRAVAWDGELFVIGGASLGGISGRVDAYDPTTNTWRSEAAMPTPRRGVSATEFESRVFVPAGDDGTPSTVFETFTRQ